MQQNLFLSLFLSLALFLLLLRDCSANQVPVPAPFSQFQSYFSSLGTIVRCQRSVHIHASKESTTVPTATILKMLPPKASQGGESYSQGPPRGEYSL